MATKPRIKLLELLAWCGNEKKLVLFLEKFGGHALPSVNAYKSLRRNAEIYKDFQRGISVAELHLRFPHMETKTIKRLIALRQQREAEAQAELQQKAGGPVPSMTKIV